MPATEISLYQIDEIEVNPGQRCVRRNGREERPRARVFNLLLYLIENRNRPVTRKELMDHVWDGVAVSDSVLYKTILEVRRVLGDDAEEPVCIKTLPKVGYQFVGEVRVRMVEAGPARKQAFPAIPRWQFWLAIGAMFVIAILAAYWRGEQTFRRTPPDDEVGWWRFAEGAGMFAKDSVGKSTGHLVASAAGGQPPRWTRGRRGTAVSIGGGNFVEGEITLPDWSAVTVAAWVRAEAPQPFDAMIFDSPRFGLYLVPGGIAMGRPGGIGAAVDAIGKWRHMVALDEGPITNVGRVFVDGLERASAPLTKFEGGSQMRWRIGQGLSRSAPFHGLIDEARIYLRPLRKLEIEAIYRCGKEQPDLTAAGKGYYYLPIHAGIVVNQDGSFTNGGQDIGGMQLAGQNSGCNLDSLRGADLGQDLKIGLDLLLARDSEGHTTEGGPYFRSRRAYPGDGIAGGTSSGHWLKLYTDGHLKLWQLRPYQVLATSRAPSHFDLESYHRIEVVVRKTRVEASLDGSPVDFEQDGRPVRAIEIPETAAGRGTLGVAFSAESNRGQIGGQRVRNLTVEPLNR